MVPKARYALDFQVMPDTVRKQGETFVKNCLQRKGDYMAHLFNTFFHKLCKDESVTYYPRDFHVTENKMPGSARILYIELPEQIYDSTVYCTAYAVAYTKPLFGSIRNVKFFTVEKSLLGTTCIGTMEPDGHHVNFGGAFPTAAENLRKIAKLYG